MKPQAPSMLTPARPSASLAWANVPGRLMRRTVRSVAIPRLLAAGDSRRPCALRAPFPPGSSIVDVRQGWRPATRSLHRLVAPCHSGAVALTGMTAQRFPIRVGRRSRALLRLFGVKPGNAYVDLNEE